MSTLRTTRRMGLRAIRLLQATTIMAMALVLVMSTPLGADANEPEIHNPTLGSPVTIAGWSAAVVLTGSMQSVIPQGSLVITQPVNARDLLPGDDITYLSSPTTSITHRIVEVIPDHQGTGRRAFITQGVDNPAPDTNPVLEDNVIGRVVFHSHALGKAVTLARDNWPLLLVFAVIAWALHKVLRRIKKTDAGAGESADVAPPMHPDRAPALTGGQHVIRIYGYSMKRREESPPIMRALGAIDGQTSAPALCHGAEMPNLFPHYQRRERP